MKKIRSMTALLLTLVFVLGGCGSAAASSKTEGQTVTAEAVPSDSVSNESEEKTAEEESVQDDEAAQTEDTQAEETDEEETEPSESEDEIAFEETDEGVILENINTDDLGAFEIAEPMAGDGETEEVNEEEMNRARSTLLYNNAALFYYYTKLNKGQKKIYKRILNVLRYPDSTERGKTFKLKAAPGSKKFNKMYSKAYMALLMDHPELFWFFRGDNNVGLQYYYTYRPDEKGRYTYQFQLTNTYKNYRKEVTAFYNEVDSFMKGLNPNDPKAKLALQVHDRMLELCDYNDEAYANRNSSSYSRDYCHSAYGALVKDSSGRWNKPVCDGYSHAYEFILQQLGFYVTVIYGDAGGSRSNASGHAWNAVYLNGNWYEVDVTWDDIDADSSWNRWEAGRLAARDSSYMRKVRHYMFLVSTDYISNFTDAASFRYWLRNGGWFQAVGNSVHIRKKKSSSDPSSEAPYCPGGKYFHGQNI